jgi:hypothetical protein
MREALSFRRMENEMGKDPEYCRLRVGGVHRIYWHNTLIFGFSRKTRGIVTNIIAQSDGAGAIAKILMAWKKKRENQCR